MLRTTEVVGVGELVRVKGRVGGGRDWERKGWDVGMLKESLSWFLVFGMGERKMGGSRMNGRWL